MFHVFFRINCLKDFSFAVLPAAWKLLGSLFQRFVSKSIESLVTVGDHFGSWSIDCVMDQSKR